MRAKDPTGKTFHRLTVLERGLNTSAGYVRWVCQCECGARTLVSRKSLESGKTKSCGCLRREGPKRGRRPHMQGPNSPHWKGGRYVTKDGYVSIWCPDYPSTDGPVRVFEHIAVMARHLGRPLYSDETVHHKNGIRNENLVDNLELRVKTKHPKGALVEDLLEWAKELHRRYAKEDWVTGS